MAFFDRLTREQIRENFTHKAIFCGLVPVYISDPFDDDEPSIVARNWIPEWTVDVAAALYNMVCWVCELVNPDAESPGFPVTITGEIL